MDAFKLLSRGASIKKDGKHKEDLGLFHNKQDASKKDLELQVDRDINFFKSKSAKKNKKPNRKLSDAIDEYAGDGDGTLKISSEEDAKQQRSKTKTKVNGEDIPLPIGSFADLKQRFDLHSHLLRNLERQHFDKPTAIQSEAIPIMLRERDLIACAPTGSGKTLGFVVPLVQALKQHSTEGIRSLIISPTKELATQIYNETVKLSKGRDLNICILNKAAVGKFHHDAASRQKFDLLIATPRRLVDSLQFIDLSRVQYIVFDEADKLFEGEKEMRKAEKRRLEAEGSDGDDDDEEEHTTDLKTFAAQSDAILAACTNVKLRKAMFSATIPSGVEEMANSIMVDPIRVIVGRKEGASDSIEQKLVFTGDEDGKMIAIRQMLTEGEFKPPVIIFCQSILRAKALRSELIYEKISIDAIHGQMTAAQRGRVVERFKDGSVWVLICTDVLARGIDFQGVNLVINYDLPQSAQAYVHRIGRTGRAGRDGRAVTFFTKDDGEAVKNVINVMQQSGQDVSEWMTKMAKLGKRQKEKLRKKPVDRNSISTVPHLDTKMQKHEARKRKQRHEMMEASKRRKKEEQEDGDNVSDIDSDNHE